MPEVRRETKSGFAEAETFRHFHSGELKRCPQCGRMIFQPCLVCLTEAEGKPGAAFYDKPSGQDTLGVQLYGRERKRYERFRLQKEIEAEQDRDKQ